MENKNCVTVEELKKMYNHIEVAEIETALQAIGELNRDDIITVVCVAYAYGKVKAIREMRARKRGEQAMNEMKEHIAWILKQIDDEWTLAKIYALVNHTFCSVGGKQKGFI